MDVAAGLMAETFAAAYESRHRFRDVRRPDGTWLYGIAGRKLSHSYRLRKVEMEAGYQIVPKTMSATGPGSGRAARSPRSRRSR